MAKKELFLGNQSGVALLYVLIALVFVGAIGSLTLNMANKEKADSGLRASSEISRFAATAGLTYATSFFTTDASNTLRRDRVDTLLAHWYANRDNTNAITQRWITGEETGTGAGITRFTNNSFLNTSEGMRFRVEIANMDFSRFNLDSTINVKFRSESLDNSGGRANNFGFYTIRGFEPVAGEAEPGEISALDMRGGLNEINTRLTVNGDTYFEDASTEWGGSINFSGHVFDGQFVRRAAVSNATFRLRDATFSGPTYFAALPGITPPTINFGGGGIRTVVRGGFGSESIVDIGASGITVENGDVFLNDNAIRDGGTWVFNDVNSVFYQRAEKTVAGSSKIRTNLPATPIPTLLNLRPTPPALTINWNVLPETRKVQATNDATRITGPRLEGTTNMFRGWHVVELTSSTTTPFNGGVFTGNTILILNTGTNLQGSSLFPESDPNSRLVVIVRSGTSASRFGNNGTIRGLIINEGSGELLPSPIHNSGSHLTINGAVHSGARTCQNADCTNLLPIPAEPGRLRLEGGDGTSVTINFDPVLVRGILQELRGFINVGMPDPNAQDPADAGIRRRTDGTPVTTVMHGRGF